MLFNSFEYFLFFPLVVLVFFLLPRSSFRQGMLLVASYCFYLAFKPIYGFLLLGVTVLAYFGGLWIASAEEDARRSRALVLSLVGAVSLLVVFKYFDFLSTAAAQVLGLAGVPYAPPLLNVVLPVGISFYTFQAVGYLVDVYAGILQPERRPLRFLLFLSFFPQLVAGPIERAQNLLPQLDLDAGFDYARVVRGLREILWGLALKVVFAGNLAIPVDLVYANPGRFSGLDQLLATAAFSFQAYADFAGYSLIAIGSARVIGVDLIQNFRQPYLSPTVADFWRTWHISLSHWLRDYVYTPLRLRWRNLRTWGLALAITLTLLIAGVWHGAGWKYVCFGLLHGLFMVASSMTLSTRDRCWQRVGLPNPVVTAGRMLMTFLLVTLSFVFFRSPDVPQALDMYASIFSLDWSTPSLPLEPIVSLVPLMVVIDLAARYGLTLASLPRPFRWTLYYAVIALVVVFGVSDADQFIYFQF